MNIPRDFLGGIARAWWILLIYGLLAIGVAALAFFRPVETIGAWVVVLGVLALIEGAISLIAAFAPIAISRGWLVLYAMASIAFGLVAIFRPQVVAVALVLVAAVWLLVGGLYRIVFAIQVRKSIEGEWLLILSGLLAVLLGVLFALAPQAGLLSIAIWIGIGALVYGLLQIVVALRLRRLGLTAA